MVVSNCLVSWRFSHPVRRKHIRSLCKKRSEKGEKKNLKRVISMVAKKLNLACISMPNGSEKSFFDIGSDTAHKINLAQPPRKRQWLTSSSRFDSYGVLCTLQATTLFLFKIHRKKTLASLNIPDMPLIARRCRKQRLRQCIDFLPMWGKTAKTQQANAFPACSACHIKC